MANIQPGLASTPRQLVEQMNPFIDLEVDYFMLDSDVFSKPTTIEMLIHDVMPRLEEYVLRNRASYLCKSAM
jgi:hypothetical protein